MLKLKRRTAANPPELMLGPMIDMVFLLLFFFIISTMYMTETKTIDMRLPKADTAQINMQARFAVTVLPDGQLLLDSQPVAADDLIARAQELSAADKDFAVILYADEDTYYNRVVALLDKFKKSGITRVALATQTGESNE